MRIVLITLLFACPVLFGGGKRPVLWERGKVLAQDLGGDRAGVYAGRVGAGVAAVPLYRSWNRITVETDTQIYEWQEVGRARIVVAVNGYIPFYREGNFFILLDTGRKKHKFLLTGMRSLL